MKRSLLFIVVLVWAAASGACARRSGGGDAPKANAAAQARPAAADPLGGAGAGTWGDAGEAATLVARLRDDQLAWCVVWWPGDPAPRERYINASVRQGSAAPYEQLLRADRGWVIFRLFEAMGQPGKAAAVHHALYRCGLGDELSGDAPATGAIGRPVLGESIVDRYYGMEVKLTPYAVRDEMMGDEPVEVYDCDAAIDLAQFAAMHEWLRALGVATPPPAPEELVAALRNDQVTWDVWWWDFGPVPRELDVSVGTTPESVEVFNRIQRVEDAVAVPLLLEAMKDPEKFVAAHYAMHSRGVRLGPPYDPPDPLVSEPPAEAFTYQWLGLTVGLEPHGSSGGVAPGGPMTLHHCRATIDPAQFPALRERWAKATGR